MVRIRTIAFLVIPAIILCLLFKESALKAIAILGVFWIFLASPVLEVEGKVLTPTEYVFGWINRKG